MKNVFAIWYILFLHIYAIYHKIEESKKTETWYTLLRTLIHTQGYPGIHARMQLGKSLSISSKAQWNLGIFLKLS